MEDWNEMIKSFGRSGTERERERISKSQRASKQASKRMIDRSSGGGGDEREKK